MLAPVAVVIGALVMASGASAATTLYTTPVPGASPDCSAAAPCTLDTALSTATNGDTVIVGVGTYPDANRSNAGKAITIRGAVIGSGRPVIQGSLSVAGAGARLSDVEVRRVTDGPGAVDVSAGAVADRVVGSAGTTNSDGCTVRPGGTLMNALCVSSNPAASSGLASQGLTGTMAVHNVTLLGHYGYFSNAGNNAADPGVTMADSIARTNSAGTDIRLNFGLSTFINTNFTTLTAGGSASSAITAQQTAAPVFRGAGDYREGVTSPTIDAGSDAAAPGELDLDGNLRKIGTHTDLGAYEFVPGPPLVGAVVPSPLTTTSATLNAAVDSRGGVTSYRLDYGPTAALGSSTPVQTPSPAATTVSFDLSGLTRRSTTHYKVVATNEAGTTTSPDATFTTKPLAPTATIAAATGVTTTTATLHATVDTDTAGGTARFDVTPAGGSTFATPEQTVTDGTVDAALTDLVPGRAYSYVLVVDSTGGETTSDVARFTTVVLPPASQVQPVPLIATPTPVFKPTIRFAAPSSAVPVLNRPTVSLFVSCGAVRCTATAIGTVTIGRKRYGSLKAPKRRTTIAANGLGTVKLSSAKTLRDKVRRYLARHPKARATVKVTQPSSQPTAPA
ncbi:MAG TPA: choice-of-anchor Q domain-containing protein [Baekduia sp.]|nr:choice-of-anchor Q domain-containing protein [Baekduia sp.]